MKQKALIAASILLGMVAGLVVAIQSPRVEANLRAQAVAYARQQGLELSVDSLRLELFPPALVVSGVVLQRPGHAAPWVQLHEGRVQVQPWPSPSGAVVINHLELDGLRINHALDLSEPPADAPKLDLPIDIRELLVWNARARVDWGEGVVALQGVDLSLVPDPEGGRRIALEIGRGKVEGGREPIGFETRLQAHLTGSLDQPERLTLKRSKVFLSRVAFEAQGAVQLAPTGAPPKQHGEQQPPLLLTLEGGADLAELPRLLPQLPPLRGKASLQVELRSETQPAAGLTAELPRVRVSGQIHNAWLEEQHLGDVKLEAVYEDAQLTLESFQVQQAALGKVTGSGSVNISERSVAFTTRVHRLSLPVVMARAGLEDAWVRAAVSGDVQGTGKLSPFRIDARVGLDVQGFEVLDGSYRKPDAEQMLAIPQARVAGKAAVTTRGVEILGVEVSRNETSLLAEGVLSFNPDVGMDLKVSGTKVSLADVGPIAKIPFAGRGSLFAALEGPYESLSISGTPDLEGLEIGGVLLGEAKATVIFENLILHVDRGTLRRKLGGLRGQGLIDFNPSQPQVAGTFSFKNIPMVDALTEVGVDHSTAARVQGVVSGQLQVHGALARPEGVVDFTSPGLAVDGVALGPMEFRVDLGGQHLARISARGTPGGGSLAATVALEPPAAAGHSWYLEGQADLTRVHVEPLARLASALPLTGQVTSQLAFSGAPHRLSGRVHAQVDDLTAWGVSLGQTRIDGDAENGVLTFNARLLEHRASATGTLELFPGFGIEAHASLQNVDVLRVANQRIDDVQVTATGTIELQGQLSKPDELVADIQLTEAPMKLQRYALQLARPAHMRYSAGRVNVKDLGLVGANLELTLTGGMVTSTTPADLELTVTGHGDIAMVKPWLPSLEAAEGAFSVRAHLTGNLEAPLLDGSGRVERARIVPKGVAQELRDLQARFDFSGRNVEIQEGSARVGDGTVDFSGGVVLPAKDSRTQIRLYGGIKNVNLRINRQLTLATSGNLSLVGPLGNLLLKGRMQLHSLRYVKNLELNIESFFPRRDAPLAVPDFAPGHRVEVDVHVQAPGNIRLDAGAVQGEFKGSLDFRGTTDSLGLMGTLTPLWAKARYRDIEFEYIRGDITFTEEFRLYGKYDITARAEGCDMEMTLNINGDSRGDYVIELSGVDENGPVEQQDPWSCLTYGVRLSQFGGQTAVSQAMGAEQTTLEDTLGSGLDLLWGVSGLDAKMRQILPYVDEVRITLGRSGRRGKNRRVAPRLVLAKEVGENLNLKYNGALDQTDDHILSLEYQVTKVATVQGSWVSISDVPVGDFGLDLRLQWQFD